MTKFIELSNVPVNLFVDRQNNIVILEIPCALNMTLCFLYNLEKNHVKHIPYELMLKKRIPNVLVKTLIIPKINRNKTTNYGKKFGSQISDIHLGELIYGNKYNLDIITNISLNINISNLEPDKVFEVTKEIEYININHRCYYYIKNNLVENKILINGMINYV